MGSTTSKRYPCRITSVSNASEVYKKLSSLNRANKVPYQSETILARVSRVYDGDTVFIWILLGKYPLELSVRVNGIDTPEMKGKGRSSLEIEVAKAATDRVNELIGGKIIAVKIYKWDKYGGRVIADIYIDKKKTTLSTVLIREGLAKHYDGGKKEKWKDEDFATYLSNNYYGHTGVRSK